ncbi:hypothetical protein SMSP2_00921 [Limihaloglobus sulfuriphilus]|uniref:PEP-CTERM protein-sorting domain-containing protein n=1 Tax=Limihaloglobus sulfuriphilus TaxID=1851148 RepID=A0A1Q2MD38_9BACT|nr:PEP-CTERM sorting domain-containing protein [Limihaloglobus sulfuriphilus]AQQ70569.1 hypothetical protein SMSP2_00921 [Limihaloglobus sulfuriphilus]
MKSTNTILVFAVIVIATVSFNVNAAIVDLAQNNTSEGTINGAIFRNGSFPIDGAGTIDPRITNQEAEGFLHFPSTGNTRDISGHNTSAANPLFTDVGDAGTDDITVGMLTGKVIGTEWYFEIIVDTNENNSDSGQITYIDDMKIYTSPHPGINTTNLNDFTTPGIGDGILRYDFQANGGDNQVIFNYELASGGYSSVYDVVAHIPVINFTGADVSDYVYVYIELGNASDGADNLMYFTTGDYPPIPVPEPAAFAIFASGAVFITWKKR